MSFEVLALVAPVGPVVLAVVGGLRFGHDPGTGGARLGAVRLDVVDVHHHVLGVDPSCRAGGAAIWGLLLLFGLGHHDQAVAVDELGVFDAAALTLHLEADLEAECAAEPVDRFRRVAIVDRRGDPGPVGWGRLHRVVKRYQPRSYTATGRDSDHLEKADIASSARLFSVSTL